MPAPSVFLDANVFRFAASSASKKRTHRQEPFIWGGREHVATVEDVETVDLNESIANPILRSEVQLLPTVAKEGLNNAASFFITFETFDEVLGLPRVVSPLRGFFEAPVSFAKVPVHYARVAGGVGVDRKHEQCSMLSSLTDPRFRELQKITRAYQGVNPVNRNQLLDALHIWCAEFNSIDFMLTPDFALVDAVRRNKTPVNTKLVTPSELLAAFTGGRE